MNDQADSLPEPGEDAIFEELLAGLKHLEPPLETRIANRQAIAAELSALNAVTRRRSLPWWRLSISVPVPLAASLLMLVAIVLPSSVRGWQSRLPRDGDAAEQAVKVAADAGGKKASIAKRTTRAQPMFKYYETETYLCGIGRVSSEVSLIYQGVERHE